MKKILLTILLFIAFIIHLVGVFAMGWNAFFYIMFIAIFTLAIFITNVVITIKHGFKNKILYFLYVGSLIFSSFLIPTVSDDSESTGIVFFGTFHQASDYGKISNLATGYFLIFTLISIVSGVIRMFVKSKAENIVNG